MAAMRIPAAPIAALMAAVALDCAATPFAVRLGTEKIVLDTPPGFSDTSDLASPRLNDLAESLTSASNRILIFALADADVRNFMAGEMLDVRRYLIAVTPKGLEHTRVGNAQFSALVSDAFRDLGKPAATTDYVKLLDGQPIGKANLLAELTREPNAVSVLQAARLPPKPGEAAWSKATPQYMFFTSTLFLLRGKALRLDVYGIWERAPDLDWLKGTTERWMSEILRLNK
jgi:hypothetical protein